MKIPSDWRSKLTALIKMAAYFLVGLIALLYKLQAVDFILPGKSKYALAVLIFAALVSAEILDFIWKVDQADLGKEPADLSQDAATPLPAVPMLPATPATAHVAQPPKVTLPPRGNPDGTGPSANKAHE